LAVETNLEELRCRHTPANVLRVPTLEDGDALQRLFC
jgi:hypothetical protein